MEFLDLLDDRVELLPLGPVDDVRVLVPDQKLVGGDHHDFEVVDFFELGRFRLGGAGHARQLFVHAEVVLERNRGERLVLPLDLNAFLGFNRLVEPVAPAPAGHQATRELVHDDHFALFHHVVAVELEQSVRPQRLVNVVDVIHVGRVVQVFEAQRLFRFGDARFRQARLAVLFVHFEIRA